MSDLLITSCPDCEYRWVGPPYACPRCARDTEHGVLTEEESSRQLRESMVKPLHDKIKLLKTRLTHERQLRLAGEVAIERMREALKTCVSHPASGDQFFAEQLVDEALATTPPTNTLASVVEALKKGLELATVLKLSTEDNHDYCQRRYDLIKEALALLGVREQSENPPCTLTVK